jgi:hypothetical protein
MISTLGMQQHLAKDGRRLIVQPGSKKRARPKRSTGIGRWLRITDLG